MFNRISISVGHLMPRKVRLVLSSMWVLGFRVWVFMIVFDYIWPYISGKDDLVRFGRKGVIFGGFFLFFNPFQVIWNSSNDDIKIWYKFSEVLESFSTINFDQHLHVFLSEIFWKYIRLKIFQSTKTKVPQINIV